VFKRGVVNEVVPGVVDGVVLEVVGGVVPAVVDVIIKRGVIDDLAPSLSQALPRASFQKSQAASFLRSTKSWCRYRNQVVSKELALLPCAAKGQSHLGTL
jgi:hypothetical protein